MPRPPRPGGCGSWMQCKHACLEPFWKEIRDVKSSRAGKRDLTGSSWEWITGVRPVLARSCWWRLLVLPCQRLAGLVSRVDTWPTLLSETQPVVALEAGDGQRMVRQGSRKG
uniref:Uncharacterized protein n=1 Tax=Micrurus carvalhoi TaxID=3147026 RepID=A0A2H6NIQ6_9SAUR